MDHLKASVRVLLHRGDPTAAGRKPGTEDTARYDKAIGIQHDIRYRLGVASVCIPGSGLQVQLRCPHPSAGAFLF
jgi:hypothetical protein